jgi:putative ATPase
MIAPPLSEKLRPQRFSDVIGHENLIGEGGLLLKIVESKKPLSLLFYGPPGSGKTSLARLYASSFPLKRVFLSGVSSGIADIKKILKEAEDTPLLNQQTILFLDEIHRFNKAQQDIFLPYLEDGRIILVGATTENPSFALNNALLSRLRVFALSSLTDQEMEKILLRYLQRAGSAPIPDESKKLLIQMAQGDARHLMNMLENIETVGVKDWGVSSIAKILQRSSPLYDKKGDGHYNLISALHKSIRGSDPDAALYWLVRMLQGGEDPLYILRRLIRLASEDVGLADPDALERALNAFKTYQILGSPEGELAIAQLVIYLALCPKSNSLYTAMKEAEELAKETGHLPPPSAILNAPTKLMKEMGYGEGYVYDHDTKEGFSGQNYFPDGMPRKQFYHPVERGFEREMKKRLDYFTKLRTNV